MVLQSADDLEIRIREAEARLGIPPDNGISIKYERRSETIGRLVKLTSSCDPLVLLLLIGRIGTSFYSLLIMNNGLDLNIYLLGIKWKANHIEYPRYRSNQIPYWKH